NIVAISLPPQYLHCVPLTRRSVLTAMSAAVAAQAQRPHTPNWKPKLGVFGQYSDANLEFVKAEGFPSMQLRLVPNLDDAALSAITDKIQKDGIYGSALGGEGNHIDADPARRQERHDGHAE